MRVLVVLCLAFALVAADDNSTSAVEDTTSAPDTTLGCIRKAIRSTIDASKENTANFLKKLAVKEDIGQTLSKIAAEYDDLQTKMDNATQVILEDRNTCEKNNEKAIFKRNCGLLAKLSFVQKNTKHVVVLMKNCIAIISRAHLDFAKEKVLLNIYQFFRDQNIAILGSLKTGVACIKNRN